MMTHTIPNPFGITFPAVVVLTVNEVMFVVNGLFSTNSHPTMRTVNILNVFFFHENPKNKGEFSALATYSRPWQNEFFEPDISRD